MLWNFRLQNLECGIWWTILKQSMPAEKNWSLMQVYKSNIWCHNLSNITFCEQNIIYFFSVSCI